MRPTTTKRTRARAPKPPNPTGRLDVLAGKLIDHAVKTSGNPLLQAFYAGAQPGVRSLLTHHVGPRTKRGRQVRKLVKTVLDARARQLQSGGQQ